MKLVACMAVRNEAWCIGLSLRVALLWCDAVIVFDHASTDRTKEIVHDVMSEVGGGRVLYTFEPDPKWAEMQHRQWMLEAARQIKATHIAIVDADEVLTGNITTRVEIANIRVMNGGEILQLPGYNLRGGINRYHSNGIWGNRWFSTAFKDDPRLHWGGDKFHSREPRGVALTQYRPIQQGNGGTMHLWGASERRLVAKHRLYRITERIRWPEKSIQEINTMYGWATRGDPSNPSFGTPETWQFKDVPESWWSPYTHLLKYLDVNAEPWQGKECERLMALHGREYFKGLDVFE